MTVIRTFNPTIHNRIANHPAVRPFVGPHLIDPAPIDFAECAARPSDYILLRSGTVAASLFDIRHRAVLDGHSIFAPECRGKEAIAIGKEMIDWLFRNTDALIVTGSTPIAFKAAQYFNRKIGMRFIGERLVENDHWTMMHYDYALCRSDWINARS